MFLKKLMKVFDLVLDYTLDGNYYLYNTDLYVCFISPHEGTDRKYLLKANFKDTFNKWENCGFEMYVEKHTMELVLDKLKRYIASRDDYYY